MAVNNCICIAKLCLGGDRLRLSAGGLTVEALIGEIREDHCAVRDDEGATAILVHSCPGVERRRCDVPRPLLGSPAHDNVASTLGGAHLDPVDVLILERDLSQTDSSGGDQL
jgi:hypothetical protein